MGGVFCFVLSLLIFGMASHLHVFLSLIPIRHADAASGGFFLLAIGSSSRAPAALSNAGLSGVFLGQLPPRATPLPVEITHSVKSRPVFRVPSRWRQSYSPLLFQETRQRCAAKRLLFLVESLERSSSPPSPRGRHHPLATPSVLRELTPNRASGRPKANRWGERTLCFKQHPRLQKL